MFTQQALLGICFQQKKAVALECVRRKNVVIDHAALGERATIHTTNNNSPRVTFQDIAKTLCPRARQKFIGFNSQRRGSVEQTLIDLSAMFDLHQHAPATI